MINVVRIWQMMFFFALISHTLDKKSMRRGINEFYSKSKSIKAWASYLENKTNSSANGASFWCQQKHGSLRRFQKTQKNQFSTL
jgi:hypothetical protein